MCGVSCVRHTVVMVDEDELLDEPVEHVRELGVQLVHQALERRLQLRQLLREHHQQVAQRGVGLQRAPPPPALNTCLKP